MAPEPIRWDAFISYASEDGEFVDLLADRLNEWGIRVWYDKEVLTIGDSLVGSINAGLAASEFGILILSPSSLRKAWPRSEVAALFARESDEKKVVLPVWHFVSKADLLERAPLLADRVAVSSSSGVDRVATALVRAMYPGREGLSACEPCEVVIDNFTAVILPREPSGGRVHWIAKYPVTNEQYRRYAEAVNAEEPAGESWNGEQWVPGFRPWSVPEFNAAGQPVVCVAYPEAQGYVDWLNTVTPPDIGVTLPAPEVWEFAASGHPASQVVHRTFAPAEVDHAGGRCNRLGISDLLGNVWEWCAPPARSVVAVLSSRPRELPVLRGGGFLDDIYKIGLALDSRDLAHGVLTRHSDLGFRVAGTLPLASLPRKARSRLSRSIETHRGGTWKFSESNRSPATSRGFGPALGWW